MKEDEFVVITWPEVQELFGLEDFRENSSLVNTPELLEEYGSSAYFVRKDWLWSHVL